MLCATCCQVRPKVCDFQGRFRSSDGFLVGELKESVSSASIEDPVICHAIERIPKKKWHRVDLDRLISSRSGDNKLTAWSKSIGVANARGLDTNSDLPKGGLDHSRILPSNSLIRCLHYVGHMTRSLLHSCTIYIRINYERNQVPPGPQLIWWRNRFHQPGNL